ncbi:chaplin [Streptomyces actuosus]|uniref:Chaplin n=1 Tax=Streptomyces actuosus TaxID=1885 RepID=A0ABS2VYC5_STRAS|nr:chaplin [Streptomyces actuosus]MBN0048136.1 chaplin [Streptomyces actuosus]
MKKSAAVVAGLVLALGGAAPAFADAGALGAAIGSGGVLSGNVIQMPVNMPINACGNSSDVTAVLSPTFGNVCVNH